MDITLLKELTELPGVSGDEGAVREYLREKAAPFADNLEEDLLGNLHIFKKGAKRRCRPLLLAAHMDEVGFIIKGASSDGYLRFAPVGGIDRRSVIGKRLKIGSDGVPGVIGLKAAHLVSPSEEKSIPKLSDLFIDIGKTDRASALSLVHPGDCAVFDTRSELFGEGLFKAKAIDDRAGCAVLLSLIKSDLPYDTHFVFTAQEEVGARGAAVASFKLEPDIGLVLEGTTAADLPNIPPARRVAALCKGAVLPFIDGSARYDKDLHALLLRLSREYKIPAQNKEFFSGGTDAGAIQRSRGGARVACIAAPVRYLHSPASVAALSDIDACFELSLRFIEAVGGISNV